MVYLDNFNDLLINLEVTKNRPLLIGIDGRPCSGKSTLADQLIKELNAEGLFLDDFFIPPTEWQNNIYPNYPFPYFHYEDFLNGVMKLASGKKFEYQPYDWDMNKLGQSKMIDPKNIIIVEGVSILSEKLTQCFHKKVFVVSNHQNELEAISQRKKEDSLSLWKELYLPSVDIYWRTKPWKRADILYAGRGIPNKESLKLFLS